MEGSFAELMSRVIRRGLCTACGTCAGVCPAGAIGFDYVDGEPLPQLEGDCLACGFCLAVCPGEEVDLPALEEFAFGCRRPRAVPDLGVYRRALTGWARDETVRVRGASGGLVTALLLYALDEGLIDAALVAGFCADRPWRTQACLATTREEIAAAAQSKYACVTVNALLAPALQRGYRRLAVVGLPCQVHGLRKIQQAGQPAGLAQSLVLIVGLFCASQFYFEGTRHLLVERLGIDNLEKIRRLSYRDGGWPGHLVVELEGGQRLVFDRHQYMYHHLMPAFKRDRCEMCVDWSAELADVAAGDFWDPQAKAGEFLGVTTCLVRSERGEEVVEGALQKGYVELEPVDDPLRLAAGIGYELKKHAAAFRLRQRRRFGWPVPDYHLEVDYDPFGREFHYAPEKGK